MDGDEDINDAVLLVLQSAAVVAATVASSSARASPEYQRTVTKLNFEKLLTSERYDGWFREHLRCSQVNFMQMCTIFRPFASFGLLNGYEHSFEKKVALLMFYLASSGSIKEAGVSFGMSKPCAVITINALLRVVCKQSHQFIKLPSTQAEWDTVMNGFASVKGFRFVCGAVDGSLFEIPRPAEYEGWYCKDGYPAINMQALCDFRRRFLDYDMRPGSYSDKKNWKVSDLGMSVKSILPIGCHFVANAGYTLTSELLTPYITREEGGQLSKCQLHYNYIHSATRMAIECAFGMLKQRFRLIRRQFEQKTVKNCARCILASMILHNILIDLNDDTVDQNTRDEDEEIQHESVLTASKREISRAKRDQIASLYYGARGVSDLD